MEVKNHLVRIRFAYFHYIPSHLLQKNLLCLQYDSHIPYIYSSQSLWRFLLTSSDQQKLENDNGNFIIPAFIYKHELVRMHIVVFFAAASHRVHINSLYKKILVQAG